MARHDRPHSDVYLDGAESRTAIDPLIQHSLRRAFPLPAKASAGDEKFRRLLDALAQRSGGSS